MQGSQDFHDDIERGRFPFSFFDVKDVLSSDAGAPGDLACGQALGRSLFLYVLRDRFHDS